MNYLSGADYFIRLIDLPPQVGGVVTPNEDGTYSVYLNSRKSREQNRIDFIHELNHIRNDDFYSDADIAVIENL